MMEEAYNILNIQDDIMKNYWSACCVLFIPLLIASCSKTEPIQDRFIPIYNKFPDIKKIHLDITKIEIRKIYPDSTQIIAAPPNASYDVGLGWTFAVMDDSILVATQQNTVKSIDLTTGQLLNEYSFVGKGPGEYQRISHLQVLDDRIMIADRSLSIVNFYDHSWNPVEEYLLDDLDNMGSSSDILFTGSKLYYPSATDEENIIREITLSRSEKSVSSFHKRLIPLGKKPSFYNEVWIDASPSGELLVANAAMPFLFIYERENLKEMLYLKLPGLEVYEGLGTESSGEVRGYESGEGQNVIVNPPPIAFDGKETIRIYPILRDILHTGKYLVIHYSNWHAKQRFIVVLARGSNNSWTHHGSYRFLKQEGEQFHVSSMSYRRPWLYLGSHFEENILRVNLEELDSRKSYTVSGN